MKDDVLPSGNPLTTSSISPQLTHACKRSKPPESYQGQTMYLFNSDHSANKKRSASTKDNVEVPRAKIPRSAFTSFESANPPPSQPWPSLSSSLPKIQLHMDHQDSVFCLPFSLFGLVPKKPSRNNADVEIVETLKSPAIELSRFGMTPGTSLPGSNTAVAQVQTGTVSPINVVDVRTGKITTTRDPRGGFGYVSDANFTPETSFNSVETAVERPSSHSGLGPVNLVDDCTGKIITTRDPRGGFGYDPNINFTPESSFTSSFDPIETTVSTPRIPLDLGKGPIHRVNLFGPLKSNNAQREDDDDTEKTVVDPEEITNKNELAPSIQASFPVPEIIEPNSSFDDVLVWRTLRDSSFTSPSTKSCSETANMFDIAKAELSATNLLKGVPSSAMICEFMLARLERMVNAEIATVVQEAKANKTKAVAPKPADSAARLRKYLLEEKEMRLEMGESKDTIEIELWWADWLVEVTQSGVMHLKVPGCTCRPELIADETIGEDWL